MMNTANLLVYTEFEENMPMSMQRWRPKGMLILETQGILSSVETFRKGYSSLLTHNGPAE